MFPLMLPRIPGTESQKLGSRRALHQAWHGETAVEIDKVGKGGLDVTEGTVKEIDRGTKELVVVTADGTEKTFTLTDHAVTDSGKDIGKGTEKGAKVVVYSSADAGKKVAHFFQLV
jgi:hypothetical protein